MKTNITYIISNINKSLAFEWISTHLSKERYNLNFILLNPGGSELEIFLKENKIPFERIKYTGKREIIKAVVATYKSLKKYKTNIVHTHLFDANIIGLTAAWLARVPKRIHTRHHSNYHHTYHPNAVKYDKIVNFLSTDIVAISKIVSSVLTGKENVRSNKVHLIHHGFQLKEFNNIAESSVNRLRQKYNPINQRPVLGVISRYLKLKGIQFIIPAFEKLLTSHPNALLILANAHGPYKKQVAELLERIPKRNYIEISFEADIFSLYKIFDLFIHVPIDEAYEAFGQTYIESLAAEVPSVFTLSGIAHEFIRDRSNALVVPYQNSDSIHKALLELLANNTLCELLIQNGKKVIETKFELNKMILSLEKLYGR